MLRLQDEHGLLDDVVDVGRHFRGGVAGGELLDPAWVDVDRVEHRAESLGDQAGEVAHTVRAAGHQAQEALPAQKATRGEVLCLPVDDLCDPIRQLHSAFRSPGGATGFEYLGHRRRRSIPARYQVLDRNTSQLTEEVGKQTQIRKGVDVGQRVEVQRLGCAQPERRAGVLAEVPGHRRAQVGLGVVDRYRSRDVQQREVDIGHATDPVASRIAQAM